MKVSSASKLQVAQHLGEPEAERDEDEDELLADEPHVGREDEAERRAERDAAEELVAERSNSRSEKLAPGSISGRATIRHVATSTTTTTSEAITKVSVNVATGPVARVCERMPSVAEGCA